MILFEINIVLVEKIYGEKLKVKSMRILGGLSDDLKLPFAELYSPMNRFVRYRTVIAEKRTKLLDVSD